MESEMSLFDLMGNVSVQIDVLHCAAIMQALLQQRLESSFCDFTLIAVDKGVSVSYPVHRCLLASVSHLIKDKGMEQNSLQVSTSHLAVECFAEFIYTGKVHGVQMMTKEHLQNMFNLARHLQSNPFMRYICRQRPDFVPQIENLPNEALCDKETCDTTTVEQPVNGDAMASSQVTGMPSVDEPDNSADYQITKNAEQAKTIANCIISKLCNGMKKVKEEPLPTVEINCVHLESCEIKLEPELSPKTLDPPKLFMDNCSDNESIHESDHSHTQVDEVCTSVAPKTLHHIADTTHTLKRTNAEENSLILAKVPKLLNKEVLPPNTEGEIVRNTDVLTKETTAVAPNNIAISKPETLS